MQDPIPTTVIVKQPLYKGLCELLCLGLMFSVMLNFGLIASYWDYMSNTEPPLEKFYSGESSASDKIARLAVDFSILPPHSYRLIEQIEHVIDDEDVKGVLLVIDSPGGLVTDSHQIYEKLRKLREVKPVYVAMKGIAASGGYYIAMGGTTEAPLYAEPTTWTGSIGVIMPRYNVSDLGEKIGVSSDSLSTGPLKDTLNPLKDLTDEEREVWNVILKESFETFLQVIDEGRPKLSLDDIRPLATGQVYTAKQALANGLIDKIGYEEDALAELQEKLGLTEVRVVSYEYPLTLSETLMGVSQAHQSASDPLAMLLESSVPRAMYMFGWHPGLRVSGK